MYFFVTWKPYSLYTPSCMHKVWQRYWSPCVCQVLHRYICRSPFYSLYDYVAITYSNGVSAFQIAYKNANYDFVFTKWYVLTLYNCCIFYYTGGIFQIKTAALTWNHYVRNNYKKPFYPMKSAFQILKKGNFCIQKRRIIWW